MARIQQTPKQAAPQRQVSNREELLQQAISITTQDRNAAYGNPEDNFLDIATYWNAYLTQRGFRGSMLVPQDVAHLMVLMKTARLAKNPGHADSLLDIAGYAACGYDCMVAAERSGNACQTEQAPMRNIDNVISKAAR